MAECDINPITDLRHALTQGNYDRLPALIAALEQVEEQVESGSPDSITTLKAEALRTEACLLAALAGVKAARRRVAEIAQAARGLTVYDRDGSKATVSSSLPKSRRV
ncbi:MAG: hypothetical protein MUC82_05690 [Cypionkella sp.]|jgi:hypothetical protein|nr:hypothetical protein [Cypionkella sp.]